MEKVLRNTDNGILVYVAPTKALVSQIAAEVYARFSKNLNSGISILCAEYCFDLIFAQARCGLFTLGTIASTILKTVRFSSPSRRSLRSCSFRLLLLASGHHVSNGMLYPIFSLQKMTYLHPGLSWTRFTRLASKKAGQSGSRFFYLLPVLSCTSIA
jgi:hypothetical protein